VGKVALKTFYYQRCGVAHSQPYAQARGPTRSLHGPDGEHACAATTQLRSLDLSGGWHDAGDYNKYVWGDLFLAMNMLMIAYETTDRLGRRPTSDPWRRQRRPDIWMK
jgi:endoglucanase